MKEFIELRDQCAQGVIARIQQDRMRVKAEGAHPKVCAMLLVMETELFNPDCNVNFLKKRAGTRDNAMVTWFHKHVGMRPKHYIGLHRFEVGAVLIREHKHLKLWQVAQLLGYSQTIPMCKAFKRWGRTTPRTYQKQCRRANADG